MNPNAQAPGGNSVDYLGDMRNMFAWLFFFLRCIAAPAEVWVRRPGTVGQSYWNVPGPVGLIGFPLLCCWLGAQAPTYWEAGGIGWFVILTVALLLVHRAMRIARQSRGQTCHSMYWGDSWFDTETSRRYPGLRGGREMVAVWAAAVICMPVSSGLGLGLFIAGVALAINCQILRHQEEATKRSMTDAYFESAWAAQRMGNQMYG